MTCYLPNKLGCGARDRCAFGSLRTLQVSSSVQPCPFLKMFWFCHNICCFDACHVVFALAVPLGVVFVSLVCPVPLCSCFLRSTMQRPDHTTPSADREKEFERDTQRERERERERKKTEQRRRGGTRVRHTVLFDRLPSRQSRSATPWTGSARHWTQCRSRSSKRFSPLRFCTRIGRRFE